MSINELPLIMLRCLILTIIIEIVISLILGYRKKDLLNVLLVNIITNPIVTSVPVYFNVNYGLKYRNISLLILELLVLVVEGFIYKKYLEKRNINPYILSFILNASSFLIGEIINYFGV
jgi:hypothetical protein